MMKCLALLRGSLRPWLAGDSSSTISIPFFSEFLLREINSQNLCFSTGFYRHLGLWSVPKLFLPWMLMDSWILFALVYFNIWTVRLSGKNYEGLSPCITTPYRCSSGGAGAMAPSSVSPLRWRTLPAGGRRGSPRSIIPTVKMDTPRCDLSGTIAWFLGGFPSSVHPPPSSPPLHSCPSGPVPISKPRGVDSSIHNWGFCCTSRLQFLPSEEDRGAETVVVLTYRWASINSTFGCCFFFLLEFELPKVTIWYTAEAQTGI